MGGEPREQPETKTEKLLKKELGEQPVSAKEDQQGQGRVRSRRRGHMLLGLCHRQDLEGQKLPSE